MSGAEGKAGARTLEDWAEFFNVPLPGPVRDQLVGYGRLLLSWGERINLTAAKSLETLVLDQLPDAFAIARRLGASGGSNRVVDVGSGGGLPAVPLALLRPDDTFTLVEATAKKVAFLRTAVRELDLRGRVEVEHRRVGGPDEEVGSFDVATSRAMLAPGDWQRLGRCLVRLAGTVFCLGAGPLVEVGEGLALEGQESYRPDRWVAELKRST